MGLCWWQRVVALCIAEQVAPHGVGGAPDHEARAPSGTKDAKGSARAKSNAKGLYYEPLAMHRVVLHVIPRCEGHS